MCCKCCTHAALSDAVDLRAEIVELGRGSGQGPGPAPLWRLVGNERPVGRCSMDIQTSRVVYINKIS